MDYCSEIELALDCEDNDIACVASNLDDAKYSLEKLQAQESVSRRAWQSTNAELSRIYQAVVQIQIKGPIELQQKELLNSQCQIEWERF
jgi:hypothetical protein